MIKMDLDKEEAEVIKILSIADDVTAVNFGPYDNGHFLIGFKSGLLIVFDCV